MGKNQPANSKEAEFNGRTFQSIAEFCEVYGLKYVSVKYYLRKGFSYQEIIDLLGQNPRQMQEKEGSKRSYACSYNGVHYSSVSQAADALGIPAYDIHSCRKKYNVSTDTAIQMVLSKKRTESHEQEKDIIERVRPVKVEGVTYPSKAEACRIYGIPYITVFSKMERSGLSFEEALVESSRANKNIKAAKTLWSGLSLSPAEPESNEKTDMMYTLSSFMKQNGFYVHCLADKKKGIGAVLFETSLHALEEKTSIYLVFPTTYAGYFMDIELIIPNLMPVENISEQQEFELLQLLNEVNQTYQGAKAGLVNGSLVVNWMVQVKHNPINNRILFRDICRFIGTAAEFQNIFRGFLKNN